MRKILLIIAGLALVMPAFAADEATAEPVPV